MQPLIAAAFGRDTASAIGVVVSADLVSNRKPAPDLYLLLLSMLGVPPEHASRLRIRRTGCGREGRRHRDGRHAKPLDLAQDFSRADLRLGSLGEPDRPLTPADAALDRRCSVASGWSRCATCCRATRKTCCCGAKGGEDPG